jgi:hypothetical protein
VVSFVSSAKVITCVALLVSIAGVVSPGVVSPGVVSPVVCSAVVINPVVVTSSGVVVSEDSIIYGS